MVISLVFGAVTTWFDLTLNFVRAGSRMVRMFGRRMQEPFPFFLVIFGVACGLLERGSFLLDHAYYYGLILDFSASMRPVVEDEPRSKYAPSGPKSRVFSSIVKIVMRFLASSS